MVGMITNLLKKGLIENLAKRLSLRDHSPFQKKLDRNPWHLLSLRNLCPNPIRRDQPAQRLQDNKANLWIKKLFFNY